MSITLTLPILPWWAWLAVALVVVYVVGGIGFGIASRSLRLAFVWPLYLLAAALGAGPQ